MKLNLLRAASAFAPTSSTARARHLLVMGLFAWTVSGCGEVVVAGDQDSGSDSAGLDAVGGEDAVLSDAQPGVDSVSDTASGDECVTDFDCVDRVKGKTPCNTPTCDNGTCTLVNKAVGTACVDPNRIVDECQQSTCDDAAACLVADRSDGTPCGLGTCGKKCATGQCVAATADDYDDGNPCTQDYCEQGQQVIHKPITDLTLSCDDESACTQGDVCIEGSCKGQTTPCSDGFTCTLDTCDDQTGCQHTANDAVCDDGDPCTEDGCSLSAGCEATGFVADAACDDGNDCTEGDTCDADGACSGTSTCACDKAEDCDQDNLCQPMICAAQLCVIDVDKAVVCDEEFDTQCSKGVCEPKTGVCEPTPVNQGKECDDGNACSSSSACTDGACIGAPDLDCDDSNPCTDDACSPDEGCVLVPTAQACDDGDPCTSDDGCENGGCAGVGPNCTDGTPCTYDTCDPSSGGCIHEADNEACEDENPCTTDTCKAEVGCDHQANDAGKCDDGDPCTTDVCKGGVCAVAGFVCDCQADSDCDDKNPCTIDSCSGGSCSAKAGNEGKACDTGQSCDQPDSGVCKAGSCSGGKAKTCSEVTDGCNSGACNPSTGKCEKVAKSDGTACDADGNGCTVGDICNKGGCVAGEAPDCSEAGSACAVGECKTSADGGYDCVAKPISAGKECDDGSFCTVGETCDGGGNCGGGVAKTCAEVGNACNTGACDEDADSCQQVAKPETVVCDDGQFCTVGDHCNGDGSCIGGGPQDCPGSYKDCKAGACDEDGDKCIQTNVVGNYCDDDNACTQLDVCSTGGVCVGSEPKTCPGGLCAVGVCDPAGGGCGTKPAAAGSACNDGNACTKSDKCDDAGGCKGSDPMTCAGDSCNDGVCNPLSGACGKQPKKDGATCDDGQACTKPDGCVSGTCKGGPWTCSCQTDADCDDSNPCTEDGCAAVAGTYACVNKPNDGQSCNDGVACTVEDVCSNGGVCAGKQVECDDGNVCTSDYCTSGPGAPTGCENKPQAGTECDDGQACFIADACDEEGACKGTPVECKDSNPCTDDACDPGTGGCTFNANIGPCDDGDKCTPVDACSEKECLPGKQMSCDDKSICTADSCSAGICKHSAVNEGATCGELTEACASGECACRLYTLNAGKTGNEYLYDVAATVGGGTLAVGRQYVSGKGDEGWLVWRNAGGKELWNKTAPLSTSGDSLRGIVALKDGSFYASGYAYLGAGLLAGGWLLHIDKDGGTLWQRMLNLGSANDTFEDVAEAAKGGAIVVGSGRQDGSYYRGWVVRYNEKGDKQWGKVYGSASDHSYFNAVASAADGTHYVVGRTNDTPLFNGTDAWIVRLNDDGTVYGVGKLVWSYTFGGSGTDTFNGLALSGDSHVWVVGSSSTKSAGFADGWLLKLDQKSGDLACETCEQRFGGSGVDIYNDVAVDGTGAVVVGANGSEKGNAQSWVSYIGSTGKPYWHKYFGDEKVDSLDSVTASGNGVFAAAGSGYIIDDPGYDGVSAQFSTTGDFTCKF